MESPKPNREKRKCKFFNTVKGCNKGSNCPFVHGLTPNESTQLKHPTQQSLLPDYPSLKASVYLSATQLKTLQATCGFKLLPGTKGSKHSLENVSRMICITYVMLYCDKRGFTLKDIQGKPRSPTVHVAKSTPLPYPHVCREILTPRDVVVINQSDNLYAHKYTTCARTDVNMTVDCLQKMSCQEVYDMTANSLSNLFFCIMSSSHGKKYGTQYFRNVNGHFDRSPDSDLSWLGLGSIDMKDGTTLSWSETGPMPGKHVIYLFTISESKVKPILPDVGDLHDFVLNHPLTPGCYNANGTNVRIYDNYLSVGDSGDSKYSASQTYHVDQIKLMRRKQKGRPMHKSIKSNLSGALRRENKEPDVPTVDLIVQSLLSKHQPTWWDTIVGHTPMSLYNQHIELDEPRKISLSTPDPYKMVKLASKLPTLLAAFPIMMLFYKYITADNKTWMGWAKRKFYFYVLQTQKKPSSRPFSRWFDGALASLLGMMPSTIGPHAKYSMSQTSMYFGVGIMVTVEEVYKSLMYVILQHFLSGYRVVDSGLASTLMLAIPELIVKHFSFGGKYKLHSLLAFVMHLGISQLPIEYRFPLHLAYNSAVLAHHYWHFSVKPRPYTSLIEGPIDRTIPVYGYECRNPLKQLEEEGIIEVKQNGKTVFYRDNSYGEATQEDELISLENTEEKGIRRKAKMYPTLVVGKARPAIPNQSPRAVVVGLCNRAMFKRNKPKPGYWKHLFKVAGQILPTAEEIKLLSANHWLDHMEGPKRKKQIKKIQDVFFGTEAKEIKTHIEPMIKLEYMHTPETVLYGDYQDGLITGSKDPRIVSVPGDELSKTFVGPYMYSIYKSLINKWNGYKTIPTLNKEVIMWAGNAEEESEALAVSVTKSVRKFLEATSRCAALISVSGDDNHLIFRYQGYEFFLTCDGKRWDGTIQEPALIQEHQYYKTVLSDIGSIQVEYKEYDQGTVNTFEYGSPELAIDYLEKEVGLIPDPNGTAGVHFKWKNDENLTIEAHGVVSRTSGSQRTTLGNDILNGISAASFVDQYKGPATIEAISEAWTQHWVDCGINPEVLVTTDLGETDFCSHRFMPVNGKYYLVPKLGKYILRMGWSKNVIKPPTHIRGMLFQYYPYRNLPFLGPLIARLCLLYGVPQLKGRLPPGEMAYNLSLGIKQEIPVPGFDTWDWMEKIYGVTQSEHKQWIDIIDNVYVLPCLVNMSVVDPLIAVDC